MIPLRLRSIRWKPWTCVRGFFVCEATIIGGLIVLVGCSGTVTPPVAPHHPTTAYVCDYGYHSSLLLPVDADCTFVEYLYGDWDWAALDHGGITGVIRAALFSNGATLGRRYTRATTRNAVPHPLTPPNTQTPIVVDADLCHKLGQTLDARFLAHSDTAVYIGRSGNYYVYVHDDESYGWIHNCNRQTSVWLDRLDCHTSGWPLMSHFTTLSATAKP
jgi:hypothetical protein